MAMITVYRNKKTGAEIVSKCEIIAEDWIAVSDEKPAEPAEKPKSAPKKAAKSAKK